MHKALARVVDQLEEASVVPSLTELMPLFSSLGRIAGRLGSERHDSKHLLPKHLVIIAAKACLSTKDSQVGGAASFAVSQLVCGGGRGPELAAALSLAFCHANDEDGAGSEEVEKRRKTAAMEAAAALAVALHRAVVPPLPLFASAHSIGRRVFEQLAEPPSGSPAQTVDAVRDEFLRELESRLRSFEGSTMGFISTLEAAASAARQSQVGAGFSEGALAGAAAVGVTGATSTTSAHLVATLFCVAVAVSADLCRKAQADISRARLLGFGSGSGGGGGSSEEEREASAPLWPRAAAERAPLSLGIRNKANNDALAGERQLVAGLLLVLRYAVGPMLGSETLASDTVCESLLPRLDASGLASVARAVARAAAAAAAAGSVRINKKREYSEGRLASQSNEREALAWRAVVARAVTRSSESRE